MDIHNTNHKTLGDLSLVKASQSDKYLVLASELQERLEIKNFRQALVDSECELGKDYIVVSRTDFPDFFSEFERKLNGRSNFNTDWKKNINFNMVRRLTFVYETGVYKILNISKSQKGKDFRNWLFNDVLPTLRKTGRYEMPSIFNITPQTIIENSKRETQLQNSKDINKKNFELGGKRDLIKYNIQNCKQVSDLTPNEVKVKYNQKSKSAKEIFRKYAPELATTMSFNDFLLIQDERLKLEDLVDVDKVFPELVKSMAKIGITFKMDE
jgi:prophage antirepressor-like protein